MRAAIPCLTSTAMIAGKSEATPCLNTHASSHTLFDLDSHDRRQIRSHALLVLPLEEHGAVVAHLLTPHKALHELGVGIRDLCPQLVRRAVSHDRQRRIIPKLRQPV